MAILTLLTSTAYGSTTYCTNSGSDASAIQSAINGGGTVTLNGNCVINNTININNAVTINGPATLTASQSQIFQVNANAVTINGLTITGGYIVGGTLTSLTFTNNVMRDLYNGSTNGGPPLLTFTSLNQSLISGNSFIDAWGNNGAYPNAGNPPPGNNADPSSLVEAFGNAGVVITSINETTISNNTFSEIASDALKITWEATTGNSGGYTTSGNVIAYNEFDHIRRIPIELQSQPTGSCPGGCNYGLTNTTGLQIKGNYIHNYTPYSFYDTWGSSLVPDGAVGTLILNNTFIADPGSANGIYGGYAPCMESSGRNSVSQGNVCASLPGSSLGFAAAIAQGNGSNSTFTSTYQNSIYCGQQNEIALVQESPTEPPSNSVMIDQYNYKDPSGCPAGSNPDTSNITAAFVGTGTVSGGNETWNISVVSNLSVRYVQFFLDSSVTPVNTQELSDLNTSFALNREWLYHLSLSTSTLGATSHMITAVVTDVAGATKTITQGNSKSGTPTAQLSPSSLLFAPQIVGSSSAPQTLSLSNAGTAPLAITSVTISGGNSGDFSSLSACPSSLATGSACNINVVYTPSIAGSESALITVVDNATVTSQVGQLSGTGVASPAPPTPTPPPAPTPAPALPTNLPHGMILWLANNAGVVGNGNAVSTWQDQSGNSNSAVQPASANQPTLVVGNNAQNAIHFDGIGSFMTIPSIPLTGLTGLTVFLVSANSQDENSAGYGAYSFLNWPETAAWGTTFFGTYQTSSHFRFGTTQVGNEDVVIIPFTRTNSFGLSEWMHNGTTDSMWMNGQSTASLTGKERALAGVGGTVVLGVGNGNTFYPGDVSELIVYNRALSTAERQLVEQYLMTKYHL